MPTPGRRSSPQRRRGDFLHDWAWADVAAFDGQPQRRYVLEEDGADRRHRWRRRSGRCSAAARSGTCRTARCSTGARRTAAERAAGPAHRPAHRGASAPGHRGQARAAARGRGAVLDALAAAACAHTPETLQVGQTRIVELGRRRALLAALRQGHPLCRAPRRTRGRARRGRRGRSGRRGHRRPARAGRRDAAPRRLPAATARALPRGVARAGRRRTRRHPRGAP